MLPINESNPDSRCYLRMTPDERGAAAVSAFIPYKFKKSNPDFEFCMTIGYRIYGDEFGGADGMVFVMHQDPRGDSALGQGGGYLGVYGEDGIKNALAIEWDTYGNDEQSKYPEPTNDDGDNNIHVQLVSDTGNITELAETQNKEIRTSSDGTPGRMWVEYKKGTLRVFNNFAGNSQPAKPQLVMRNVDLASLFDNGRTVNIGYTASVGFYADNQDVTSWQFSEQASC